MLCTSSPQGSQLPQEEVWPQQPGKHRFLEPNSSPWGLLHNYLIIFFGFVIKLIVVMELVAMCRVIYPKPWQFLCIIWCLRIFKEVKSVWSIIWFTSYYFAGDLFTSFTRAFLFADDVMSDVLLVLAPFQLRPKKKIKNWGMAYRFHGSSGWTRASEFKFLQLHNAASVLSQNLVVFLFRVFSMYLLA